MQLLYETYNQPVEGHAKECWLAVSGKGWPKCGSVDRRLWECEKTVICRLILLAGDLVRMCHCKSLTLYGFNTGDLIQVVRNSLTVFII